MEPATHSLIQDLPSWVLFLAVVVLVLTAAACGYRAGSITRRRDANAAEGPIGSVVGAVLGLLAFMLAFTFSIASGRFDTRKALLLEEVNAIGTAALRAELLPQPEGAQCRELLRQYVDVRLAVIESPHRLDELLVESERIQRELWKHAAGLARGDTDSELGALFVESLNELIDLHTSRVTVALQYRIPTPIWLVLGGLTFLAMAGVGYHFGVLGRGAVTIYVILALSFALVVSLIADLDRVTTSTLRISQEPMIQLKQQLAPPAGGK